ncbi:hypothetical protein [Lentibacillus sp. CBA3610]|uniref:hypothetical protein n=1 Tax=Lentibacillus sp. CBA3610 TaxID=2518176 RepID=UPI001596392A|nr:hypothetical protein [Lentibacillus sp. CBA3610]QKY71046.1 hypothetical protein Len3610_17075 [Lentibacillus sp. CBA3610]
MSDRKMKQSEWAEFTLQLEEELDTLLFLDLIKLENASESLISEIRKSGKVLYVAESASDKSE